MTAGTALVTGAAGQDGVLLTGALRARGVEVVAVVGPDAAPVPDGFDDVRRVSLDLTDLEATAALVAEVAPDRIFHLAALSSVGRSWADPVGTGRINGMVTVALLQAAWEATEAGRPVRMVHASSGEIFAGSAAVPQDERTPVVPTSPYGAAKAFAHQMAGVFRARGLHVSNAVLYNHESPHRAEVFVTRRITAGVAAIARGRLDRLTLGNLDARRDWGWAPDYVDAMMRIAEHHTADDFVVATGVSHSVRDFVAAAFAAAGIDDWQHLVETDAALLRPTDVVDLVGDATKARTELGWRSTKDFDEIVAAMVRHDLDLLDRGTDPETAVTPGGRTT